MRSIKLLVAAAAVAALLSGPVYAVEDAMSGAAPVAATETMKPAPKHQKNHAAKKHHAKKHHHAKHQHGKKEAGATPAVAPAPEAAPAQ
ncbi:MAG: hypothetical protein WAO98_05010 [Alphaproteobacteria bacterium]